VGKIRLITCSLDGGECPTSLSGGFTTRYLGGPCVPSTRNEAGRFADVDRLRTHLFAISMLVSLYSLVCIATRYGLDGLESNPCRGRDFLNLSRPVLGPTQPSVQRVPGIFSGVKRPGRDVDHPPPSSTAVKRAGLYIYSPFLSSWPVLLSA
jgi:hypothetical protein